ncbi:MAG: hypothetical protein QTN59_11725 [Candidatus Electrothrix communis]|nr:MAG: hypothetical protein QTN59_11725 [Candidatus Electrothrix communis]
MIEEFSEHATRPYRALQIWLILIGAANNRQIFTYGMVADILGYNGAGTLAHTLGHIMFYCLENELPPLTILVVNQETGLPGDGLTGADLNAGRESVFNYDWYSIIPPTPEDLKNAYDKQCVG